MHMFTALFNNRVDAEAVQNRLTQLGIVDLDEPTLHDKASAGFDDKVFSTSADQGIWSSPKMVFPPDRDRHVHEQHIRQGGSLLTVKVDDVESDKVRNVLEASNAVNVEEREREFLAKGLLPVTAGASADEEVIPIAQEELSVGKRQVDRGGVRVRAYTVETPVQESVSLREEHVEIERRSVNERIDDAGGLFTERTLEATERVEEVVVGKEARVIEEISVRKDVGERTETISDTVRHTEVEVENLAPSSKPRI